MANWFSLFADISDSLQNVSTDTASMSTPATTSLGTRGELRYSSPCNEDKNVRLYVSKIDAHWFAIMETEEAFVMRAGLTEQETAFEGWFKKWKHWRGGRDRTVETLADFIDMPLIRSYEVVAYKGGFASLMTYLRGAVVVPESVSLDLFSSRSDLRGGVLQITLHTGQIIPISRSNSGSITESGLGNLLAGTMLSCLLCRWPVAMSFFPAIRFVMKPRIYFVLRLHRFFPTVQTFRRTSAMIRGVLRLLFERRTF